MNQRGFIVIAILAALSVFIYLKTKKDEFPLDLSYAAINRCWVFMRSHPEYEGDLWWNYITGDRAIKTRECRIEHALSGQVVRTPPFCVKALPDNYVKERYNSVQEAIGRTGVLAVVARPLPYTSQEEDVRILLNIAKRIRPLCAKRKVCVMRLVRMCCCDEYGEGDNRYHFYAGGWALPAEKGNVIMVVSIRLRYAMYEGFKPSDLSYTKKFQETENHRPHELRPSGEIMRDVIHEMAHSDFGVADDPHDEAWKRRFIELRSLYKETYGHYPEDESFLY